jgi:hypothetical protein
MLAWPAHLRRLQPCDLQQKNRPYAESAGEPDERVNCNVLAALLDVLQVPVADPRGLAELLLREPELDSPSAHVRRDRPELPLDVWVPHPRFDTLLASA